VGQALEYFQEVEKISFTLSNYWMKLKDYLEWKLRFASCKKGLDA
jgi:hypothetical protein